MVTGPLRLDLAALAQLFEHRLDALLVDDAHAGVGNAQPHPALLAFHPEAAVLQVRIEPAYGLVVGVGDVVSHLGLFACYLADACHGCSGAKGTDYRATGPPLSSDTLKQAALGKRHGARPGDDEMVEHLYVDQSERAFQGAGEDLVGMARLGDAGGGVMRENHRRAVMLELALHDLPTVKARLGQRSLGQFLAGDDAMLRVQEKHHEYLLFAPAECKAPVV